MGQLGDVRLRIERHARLNQAGQQLSLNDVEIASLPQDSEVVLEAVLQSDGNASRLSEELPACAQPAYAYTDLMNVVYAVIVTGLHAIYTGQESTVADDLVHAAVRDRKSTRLNSSHVKIS